MENKINIAELLKDCPKGMELNCTMYDNLSYDYVNGEQNRIYCKVDLRDTVWFTIYGCVNLSPNAKCVIFPKGKTTWEGFVPPCKFKDGDIVSSLNSSIYIFTNCSSVVYGHFFAPCGLIADRNSENHHFKLGNISISVDNMRLATEEEKQKLFDAIKDNGYKWNEETKTLEKLPRFKVGDRIRSTIINSGNIYTVLKIEASQYVVKKNNETGNCNIYFNEENNFELAPSKFDIANLKPFESRVLVRNDINQLWLPAFWGYKRDNGHATTFGWCQYCIPYEDNQHLLGTTNDCDDFYKTWEK